MSAGCSCSFNYYLFIYFLQIITDNFARIMHWLQINLHFDLKAAINEDSYIC